MNTILYLNDRYCTSIEDIKDVLSKVKSLDSPIVSELRCAIFDGTLSNWLSEGTDHEKALVSKLSELDTGAKDDQMLNFLSSLFAQKETVAKKPKYTEYFVFHSAKYIFDGAQDDVCCDLRSDNSPYIYIKRNTKKCKFKLSFEILKSANLDYTITIKLKKEKEEKKAAVIKEANLCPKTNNKTISCECSLDLSKMPANCEILVYIDNKFAKSFELSYRPANCSIEQWNVIKNILRQMTFVPGKTGKFRIFDGEEHEVTLSGYYISPLITNREVDIIINVSQSFAPDTYSRSTRPYIDRFIEELNKLSDRIFSLPSEAQWLNAAKGGHIKTSVEEWMQDRHNPYAVMVSTKDPVCVVCDSSVDNYVVRWGVNGRSWREEDKYIYFRLVIMA